MLFNSEQIAFLRSLGLNYNFEGMTGKNITMDEGVHIEDAVGDKYNYEVQNTNERTPVILMCEKILDILANDVD